MDNWKAYKKNIGSSNKHKHISRLVWCWQCLAVAHRKCIEYLGAYKILVQDYYQCSLCAMGEIHKKKLPKLNLITFKKIPFYVQYVIYSLYIYSIFVVYTLNLYYKYIKRIF